MSQRGEDGHAQVRGHEGGDDDDEREKRDERLTGQGDTAVDELCLEHPVPYFPQQRLLSQPRMAWTRPRTFSNAPRLVLSVPDSAMIPPLVSTDPNALAGYADICP